MPKRAIILAGALLVIGLGLGLSGLASLIWHMRACSAMSKLPSASSNIQTYILNREIQDRICGYGSSLNLLVVGTFLAGLGALWFHATSLPDGPDASKGTA